MIRIFGGVLIGKWAETTRKEKGPEWHAQAQASIARGQYFLHGVTYTSRVNPIAYALQKRVYSYTSERKKHVCSATTIVKKRYWL